ncbi:MAG: aminopeptidase [Clostridia bacterium]|nr:aminopeptidase [Clostridia bacterium]
MKMSEATKLQKSLFNDKRNGWADLSEEKKNEIYNYCNSYMEFLNNGKTEREIVKESKNIADSNGFKNIEEVESLKPGDKVYYINKKKAMYLAVIGYDNIENGINVIGAHADSPRLDLKPNPLYEDDGFAFFKTQYYGGIKKYQWTTIPLAIHGVIVKKNGESVEVNIGENENDPVFVITDLLPHLAQEQMQRKLGDGIKGEELNILIGSIPYNDSEVSEKVKLNILNLLNKKYGIVEADFLSAELEIVPAFKARSLGFDESMIAAYGQDDKICVYTSLSALMNVQNPKTTAVCLIADKEEIGSMGNTGMQSNVFDTFISEILNKLGVNKPNMLDKVFCNSKMLSADVDAGFDPTFASVAEKNNASYLGRGIGLNKYTGGRGKGGSSDANAEFVAYIRNMLENNNLAYQIAELGKVDLGGGGTIAYILANKGMDVIDCGVPVLSMHAPYEVTSKFDVYTAFETYKTFFNL